VDIDGSGDRVSIRWSSPERWGFWSFFDDGAPDVRYSITAPRNARLEIDAHNASIDIRDLAGHLRVDTHNGTVRAANLTGSIDVSMHNGRAFVDFASFTGGSRVSSEGHNMHVDSDFPLAGHASGSGRSDSRQHARA
jgi:hypothetical protein